MSQLGARETSQEFKEVPVVYTSDGSIRAPTALYVNLGARIDSTDALSVILS